MEKPARGLAPVIRSAVVLLGLLAFSCCVAAEFKKAKEKDMKLDGNLCSMPRTAAFGLGVAALVCLSVAQVVGTSAVAIRLRSKGKKPSSSAAERRPAAAIALLVLSWVSFGLATALLGAGTSMSKGQPYGQGWMDGKCYVVRTGVYLGSAALVAVTVALAAVMASAPFAAARGAPLRHLHQRTGPDEPHLPK